jgi:hypothetical protein
MRLLLIATFALISACSSGPVIKLYEGAELLPEQLLLVDIPVELEVVSINERRINGVNKLFGFGDRTLHLQPGNYRIVAYYKNLFELPGGNHEVVKSEPVLFRISGAAGSHHRLIFKTQKDVDEARKMSEQFNGYSVDLANNEQRPTEASGMILSGGFLNIPTAPPTASHNSIAPSTARDDTRDNTGDNTTSTRLSHSDLLKASWRNASSEERREFLRWIAEQAPASNE